MGRTFRIGQAAKMLGLNASVLRFWESQFEQLEPIRTRKGQRLYTQEHVDRLEVVRRLLHDEGLTIEGAKKRLEQELREDEQAEFVFEDAEPTSGAEATALKREIVGELLELKRLLSSE